MGATAAIATLTAGYFAQKSGKQQQQKTVAGIASSARETADAMSPPTLPPPPSASAANADAGKAMTQAAQRYRKQKGAGFGSTILTSGAGDTSTAPTFRKTLLGL